MEGDAVQRLPGDGSQAQGLAVKQGAPRESSGLSSDWEWVGGVGRGKRELKWLL